MDQYLIGVVKHSGPLNIPHYNCTDNTNGSQAQCPYYVCSEFSSFHDITHYQSVLIPVKKTRHPSSQQCISEGAGPYLYLMCSHKYSLESSSTNLTRSVHFLQVYNFRMNAHE